MVVMNRVNHPVVVFWDIDGTLLSTGGAGVPALVDSFKKILGVEIQFDRLKHSGLTDFQIINSLITKFTDLEHEEAKSEIPKIKDQYIAGLELRVNSSNTFQLDRVSSKIEYLKSYFPFMEHWVVTGNVYEGAKIKLEAAGLDHLFKDSQFFCCDSLGPRSEIVNRALQNRSKLGQSAIVVGDTIHDLNAASSCEVPVLLIQNQQMQDTLTEFAKYRKSNVISEKWSVNEFYSKLFELI